MSITIPDCYKVTFKEQDAEEKIYNEDELILYMTEWHGLTSKDLNEPLSSRVFENKSFKIEPQYYQNNQ